MKVSMSTLVHSSSFKEEYDGTKSMYWIIDTGFWLYMTCIVSQCLLMLSASYIQLLFYEGGKALNIIGMLQLLILRKLFYRVL